MTIRFYDVRVDQTRAATQLDWDLMDNTVQRGYAVLVTKILESDNAEAKGWVAEAHAGVMSGVANLLAEYDADAQTLKG